MRHMLVAVGLVGVQSIAGCVVGDDPGSAPRDRPKVGQDAGQDAGPDAAPWPVDAGADGPPPVMGDPGGACAAPTVGSPATTTVAGYRFLDAAGIDGRWTVLGATPGAGAGWDLWLGGGSGAMAATDVCFPGGPWSPAALGASPDGWAVVAAGCDGVTRFSAFSKDSGKLGAERTLALDSVYRGPKVAWNGTHFGIMAGKGYQTLLVTDASGVPAGVGSMGYAPMATHLPLFRLGGVPGSFVFAADGVVRRVSDADGAIVEDYTMSYDASTAQAAVVAEPTGGKAMVAVSVGGAIIVLDATGEATVAADGAIENTLDYLHLGGGTRALAWISASTGQARLVLLGPLGQTDPVDLGPVPGGSWRALRLVRMPAGPLVVFSAAGGFTTVAITCH